MVTDPAGVNFSALLSRFSTTCFTFCRSLLSGRRPRGIFADDASVERLMIGSSSDITSLTSSGTSKVDRFSGIRPASMRVMSRMSLISASRWREFESMRVRLLRCWSEIAPVTPLSSMCV